jgi:threonine dehydrogenase-like Zn-dependent dehydrogenase
VHPGDRVAVLGDGKLGLLIAQVLEAAGCTPTLVGKHVRKLAIARRRGVRTAALHDLPEREHDVVVEATGSAKGFRAALALLRPCGTLVLKSTYHGELSIDAAPLVIDEIRVIGSRCGPFEPAIHALRTGSVDPRALIDAVLPLERAEQALERAAEPGTLKVLLDARAS